ncbi:MAG TPA: AAA family ATPase, partial [Niastella sp.]
MIIAFDVQNFGSVKERQRLSFEAEKSDHLEEYYVFEAAKGVRLLKLGLIYGANASGKSTILKALGFLRDLVLNPEEKKTDKLNFSPFLFDPNTPKQNSILSVEFLQNHVRYYYEVEFNRNAIIKERLDYYNPTKANIFKRDTDLDSEFSRITFGSKIKTDKASEKTLASNTLWNNTVLGGFLKTNIELKELKDVIDWFSKHMRSIIVSTTGLD